MDRESEIELARQLIAGDRTGYDEFDRHFRAKIFHYSWLMCGQREDAEEVSQETLFKAFESFEQLREPERVRPWVFRIAKNVCLMKRRKSIFAPAREMPLEDWAHAEDPADQPDGIAIQAERMAALDQAIRELPEAYRPVILLRDVEELSTSETAEILDLTEDVVRTRLHRGRVLLRGKLDSHRG